MSDKRILYVNTHGATVYAVAPGKLRQEDQFSADENGLAGFTAYLQREPEALFYLLGDVPEEDFQQENIPHVGGADRTALINRKLSQTFRDTKLSLAMSLGREKGDRRDDRVLFAAFTNTQSFQPWLKAMLAAETRLVGVYSTALTGNALYKKMGLKDGKLLIISVHRGGIRQNYFEAGRIRFSRLTPFTETDARRAAQACVAESGKILQYLEGLRLVPREGPPLKTLVLAPHDQLGVFGEVCTGVHQLQFEVLDEQAVSAKIGLKSVPAGTRGEALFCYLLGLAPPAEQYAQKPQRRMYRLWQMRQTIFIASAAVFAASVLVGGYQFAAISSLHAKTGEARRMAQGDAQRYEEVRKTFPAMPTSTENLKAAVQRFEEVERLNATPETMLADISSVLNVFSGIELDSIEWAVTRKPGEVGSKDAGGRSEITASPAPAAIPGAPPDKTQFQVAYVVGRIVLTNRSDYRAVQDYLDSFAEALRKMPGTRVDLVKLPFDTRPGVKLTFVTSDQQKNQAFALRIARKIT